MASFKAAKIMIQNALADLLSKDYLRELGAEAAAMIRTRTQLGYSVAASGEKRKKLAPLKESTKKARKRLQLNENTSPSKSNLTRTGQLLSSLGVTNVAKTSVTIGPSGSRDDGKTNEEVAAYAEEGSVTMNRKPRPFLSLSDVEQKRLREKVRKDLQAKLKKSLTKVR